MADLETPLEQESRWHRYEGNHVPWYVHAAWLVFWVCVAVYLSSWLLPALRNEIAAP